MDRNDLIVLCLLGASLGLFSGGAKAQSWDTTDKALAGVALTALAVDWGQTRYIAQHPEKYKELNGFLGNHPSVKRVDTYFPVVIIGGYFLADYLSSENRKLLLGIVAVVEIGVTARNRHIGVKIAF